MRSAVVTALLVAVIGAACTRDSGSTEAFCDQVRLVSGVQRVDAHRFYEREGMRFEAKYFSMDLGQAPRARS